MAGWVTFLVGSRVLAVRSEEIREVLRDAEIVPLTGVRAPVTAALGREGPRVPLVDLREHEARADVLVLATVQAGVVVDGVLAELEDDGLEPDPDLPEGLPAYVLAALRRPGAPGPGRVLQVDLESLAGLVEAL
ncbi:CheW domain-containing protein [Motilibacter aurantiacus]|uniref:chemotaxis protein CheW n=1 Tax=Motilibacter aurantiacus TaxID=2714955 RepID=UPI00140DF381|nr:chemotaxis protein CheW [Motilibacter aurantiacus]NHC44214.1 hypothetical protein [Motilibacter aurantiacus]